MNTDIEDMRLLSLDVAEIFYARSRDLLEAHRSNLFDATQMIALVYEKSLNFLQADQDISPSTRAAVLKSLCGKYTLRMFDLEYSGPNLLSMPKMTESFVDQVWTRIENSYLRMIASDVAPTQTSQTIEVQNVGQSSSSATASLKRKSF